MPTSAPLPRKVDHQFGEPAYSLLVRTLEHNGSRRIGKTIDRVIGAREKAASQWDPVEVARVCKADPVAVVHATPAVGSKTATVMGQTLSAEHMGIRTRRWCPKCLAEGPYHRVWWDILPVTSCPKHGIKLSAACGCEGRSLRWRSGPLRHCPVGHALEEVVCAEADPDILAFDAYVVARLLGGAEGGRDEFDDVGLGELLTVSERLGKASFDEASSIHVVRKSHGVGRLHAEGFRILRGLPAAFDDLLSRIRPNEAWRNDPSQFRRVYGGLQLFVRRLPDHSIGAALRAAFAEHANRNLVVRAGTLLDGRTPYVTGGVTLSAATDALGIRYERLLDLLDQLGIPRDERGTALEISWADFEALREKLEGWANLTQVGEALHLPPLEITGLASSGLLDVITAGDGFAGWIFPANAANNLLTRLQGLAGKPGPTPEHFVSFPVAARRHGTSVAGITALALAGSVGIKARWASRKGILRFRVDQRALPLDFRSSLDASVTTAVAARELCLSRTAMEAVLASALLQTEVVDGVLHVPAGEIARFRAAWAPMRELRTVMGVKAWMPVAAALAEAGVDSPLANLPLRQRIYPREDALQACAAAAASVEEVQDGDWERGAMAKALNVSMLMVQQLIEAGLVKMNGSCRSGRVSDVEVARIKETYVTLSELAVTFGMKGPRTALSILDKTDVRATCRRPEFHAYLFPRQEASEALRSWADARRAALPSNGIAQGPTLSASEVATRLGTGKQMVLQLVANGLLASARRGRAIVVPASEVERFTRRYVFANELARLMGRVHRHGVGASVTKVLIRSGVRPVCSYPEFVNYVFERSEAISRLDVS